MTDLQEAGGRAAADPRRRWAMDIALTVVVTAAQLGASHATFAAWQSGTVSPPWAVYPLLAVAALVLIARRRFPVAVLAVSLGTTLAAGAIGPSGMIRIALIVAFFNAVIAGKQLAAAVSLIIGYLVSFWPPGQIGDQGHASVAVALGVAAWMLVMLAAAEFIRIRSQRAAELARSRADLLRRQVSDERMRMARDLHDVVAHNISVINVQANTALHLMDRQPERAREALTAIHDVSKQALTELRSVLGVLRSDDETAPRSPSPGLGQLEDLISAVGKTGLEPRLRVQGQQRELPAGADLAAYRIIQEALTNTARHSASQHADVVVSFDPGGVLIQVDDAGPARSLVPGPAGNGITGMAERAHALGGRLSAGRRPDGGFRVAAWLPGAAVTAGPEAAEAGERK